jgi:predicted ATP-binding protein involved in virulence
MSDGFKALINIVSEIAYRCIMLNGYLGREAVRLTPGVVLIDEVDLYLHPHWQRHVLQDLKEAFPNIQFIVTTHSPFIIQSVGEGQLISLDNDVDEAPDTLSLEEIAASYMDMNNLLRSKQYQKMYNAAAEYYRLSQKDKATPEDLKRLQNLEAEFSHNPVYAAVVNAMIEKIRI